MTLLDDEFDDEKFGLLDDDSESILGELGCCMPDRCLMVGSHYTSECHDAEMLESYEGGRSPQPDLKLLNLITQKLNSIKDLPCRVDEMTSREYEIYCIAFDLTGFLMFLKKQLEGDRTP